MLIMNEICSLCTTADKPVTLLTRSELFKHHHYPKIQYGKEHRFKISLLSHVLCLQASLLIVPPNLTVLSEYVAFLDENLTDYKRDIKFYGPI